MQWTVLVLSLAVLVTARTRSESREDFGIRSLETPSLFHSKDKQLWNPHYQKDLYQILSRIDEKSDSSDPKFLRKRALSVLSRWKPIGNLGMRQKSQNRSSSRAPMMSMVPGTNVISAEYGDGGRPLGQPLRWGRKR